ncbi:sensor histidine kinase [Amycolatopsis nigrescens]|uniref:sensor histidine kinase n=1 Tax=Amycolatopsis nigrescens TaxID=381445 RepID=UPI000684F0C9|nr:histidine kinase [Amycolatopsis nigrescens]
MTRSVASVPPSGGFPPSRTAELPGAAGDDRRPRQAWRLAGGIVTVQFSANIVLSLLLVLAPGPAPARIALAVLSAGALLAIQLRYFGSPATDLHSAKSRAMLVLQIAVVYLPMITFGQPWVYLLGFPAGSVLLVLRRGAGWTAFAAIVASTAWIQVLLATGLLDILYNTLSTAISGVSVFLLTRLAQQVTMLHAARDELARGAVAEERLRFARDLHDLLGLSLSAIALRGELAQRLVRSAPERARRELDEITATARRALSDVRAVASGYRELSLEQEFQAAQALLEESEVDLRLELGQRDIPVQIRTVLAAVLREGVTNVLQHSEVRHCEIAVVEAGGTVSLDIVNDGVQNALDEPAPTRGTGLADLTAKVTALGGTVAAGPEPGGRFRLHAVLPLHEARHGPARTAHLERESPRLGGGEAAILLAAVVAGMCVAAVVHVLYLTTNFWQVALTTGYLAALLVLQLSYFSRATARLRSRQAYGLLFVQACLVYLPMMQLKEVWVSFPGLLICNALLVLRPAVAWPLSAAVVASIAWVHAGFTTGMDDVPFNVLATVNTGFLVFGLSWLTRVATDLDTTRRRLAEVAVAEERLRFARDLHDLLGLSLSAITLKTDLTGRLLLADPDRAATELAEILDLTRQALTDVRSVASGYRELSLDKESRSAEAVLTAADVQVRIEVQHGELSSQVGTVLAVVLREGVTNVLRHSRVERCEIAVRQAADKVLLEIVNDGVAVNGTEPVIAGDASSSGIRNLSDRVATLGGELTAGLDPDGRFRLRAVVPAA